MVGKSSILKRIDQLLSSSFVLRDGDWVAKNQLKCKSELLSTAQLPPWVTAIS